MWLPIQEKVMTHNDAGGRSASNIYRGLNSETLTTVVELGPRRYAAGLRVDFSQFGHAGLGAD